MIIADTSGLLALFNSQEPAHEAVVRVVERHADVPLVVSPYVLAELDYLVQTRHGVAAELAVLEEVAAGGYELAAVSTEDLAICRGIIARYDDQRIGLADASLVMLAHRYATREILTLDHRHFSVLRTLDRQRFRIVPA